MAKKIKHKHNHKHVCKHTKGEHKHDGITWHCVKKRKRVKSKTITKTVTDIKKVGDRILFKRFSANARFDPVTALFNPTSPHVVVKEKEQYELKKQLRERDDTIENLRALNKIQNGIAVSSRVEENLYRQRLNIPVERELPKVILDVVNLYGRRNIVDREEKEEFEHKEDVSIKRQVDRETKLSKDVVGIIKKYATKKFVSSGTQFENELESIGVQTEPVKRDFSPIKIDEIKPKKRRGVPREIGTQTEKRGTATERKYQKQKIKYKRLKRIEKVEKEIEDIIHGASQNKQKLKQILLNIRNETDRESKLPLSTSKTIEGWSRLIRIASLEKSKKFIEHADKGLEDLFN